MIIVFEVGAALRIGEQLKIIFMRTNEFKFKPNNQLHAVDA